MRVSLLLFGSCYGFPASTGKNESEEKRELIFKEDGQGTQAVRSAPSCGLKPGVQQCVWGGGRTRRALRIRACGRQVPSSDLVPRCAVQSMRRF